MEKTGRAIMWTGAIVALVFGITQTAAAIFRGDWFVALCFAAIIAGSKGLMQVLDTEEKKGGER